MPEIPSRFYASVDASVATAAPSRAGPRDGLYSDTTRVMAAGDRAHRGVNDREGPVDRAILLSSHVSGHQYNQAVNIKGKYCADGKSPNILPFECARVFEDHKNSSKQDQDHRVLFGLRSRSPKVNWPILKLSRSRT